MAIIVITTSIAIKKARLDVKVLFFNSDISSLTDAIFSNGVNCTELMFIKIVNTY